MWRFHGFVGRVLGRCHGSTQLRLSQGHHVEDEVLNTSTVLSSGLHPPDSGSQREKDGGRRRREKTSTYCYTGLLRNTALDAMGWGAAAVLFVQLWRRVHSQFSVSEHGPGATPGARMYEEVGHLQKCGYRVLLEILCQRDILPRSVSVKCLKVSAEDDSSSSEAGHAPQASENSFSHLVGVSQSNDPSHSGKTALSENSSPGDLAGVDHAHEDHEGHVSSSEEDLREAEENLQRAADSSVPVILNIIGIESARKGDVQTAFSCFLLAAEHGYSKAQFNVGVCYETGRGVSRDLGMAAKFYRRAAAGGHGQAQYRYAKHLLHSRGQQSPESTRAAVDLLERAAASGVREAQAYLGVLFTQEPFQDWQKAVHYLRIAAENGDTASQLNLGHCLRQGLGVASSIRSAVRMYQQAAESGNLEAKHLFSAYKARVSAVPEDAFLRPTRSSPCFPSADLSRLPWHPRLASQALHHSWSAGCLRPRPPAWSLPELPESQETGEAFLSLNAAPCGWTIGVG